MTGDRTKKKNPDIPESGVCAGKSLDLRPWDSFKKTDTEQLRCQIDQVIIDFLHWNYVIVFYLAECEA